MPGQLRCSYCREPIERDGNEHFPFCSPKCQMLDLSKWLNEEYSLPAPLTERDISVLERAMAHPQPGSDSDSD